MQASRVCTGVPGLQERGRFSEIIHTVYAMPQNSQKFRNRPNLLIGENGFIFYLREFFQLLDHLSVFHICLRYHCLQLLMHTFFCELFG